MNNYTNYDSNNSNDNINIIIVITNITITHMKQSVFLILIKYHQIDLLYTINSCFLHIILALLIQFFIVAFVTVL